MARAWVLSLKMPSCTDTPAGLLTFTTGSSSSVKLGALVMVAPRGILVRVMVPDLLTYPGV